MLGHLSAMIDSWFFDSQNGEPGYHPWNIDCSNSTNINLNLNDTIRGQKKKN